eukprot:TRINITY_DN16354_c0_g2_i1.p1 TRINITY_DN16354_c0_g2~~TRINITY_DN16354_c0_g2_i1.p1  ORF type:complete len:789 (-),score=141.01 TRINITY_DN16354_c0_g2_i1:2289-4655(-)
MELRSPGNSGNRVAVRCSVLIKYERLQCKMKRTNLLLIASESGDGQFRNLIDPELKADMEKNGIFCSEAFLRDVKLEDFGLFDVVLLMRTPVAGHAKDDGDFFDRHMETLEAYVQSGGGLIMMFSENYGKSVTALNRLGKRFDISFEFNIIEETDATRLSSLPNMPEGKLICVDVAPDCPFAHGQLEIITEGGHGTQHLTCRSGADWHTVLKGSESCVSHPFPDGLYANSGHEPIFEPEFAAWREYGDGRVIAFPGASPFWLANAGLKRWKKRLISQENNRGFDFIRDMIRWAGGEVNRCDLTSEIAAGFPERRMRAEDFSFKYISSAQKQELNWMVPYKTYIGYLPEAVEAEAFCRKLKDNDYFAAILLKPYRLFSTESWKEFSEQCKQAYKATGILARPGFEQDDDEGNYCVVFNVEELPGMRSTYPNSNMLEDLLVKLNAYSAVYARVGENRIPAWRHGGYNLLEIQNDEDIELYRDRISSSAFLSAVKICRTPEQINGNTNYLMARELENVFDAVCENRHFNFISSGPLIRKFFWDSECVIDDDWEGFWLEWDDGDQAKINIELQAESDISEVLLYNGKEILQRWTPGSKEFTLSYMIELVKDMRLHLTARDDKGGELEASWPLYTRNRRFWAHMGSDQMNDYHNVWFADKYGSLGIGRELYETCGFVTLGYAWGDYLRITPPVKWHDIMPQGVEVSSLAGNFQSFHPSPFLITSEGKSDFLNNHRRTLGECDSSCHYVMDECNGSWLDDPEAKWQLLSHSPSVRRWLFRKSDLPSEVIRNGLG